MEKERDRGILLVPVHSRIYVYFFLSWLYSLDGIGEFALHVWRCIRILVLYFYCTVLYCTCTLVQE